MVGVGLAKSNPNSNPNLTLTLILTLARTLTLHQVSGGEVRWVPAVVLQLLVDGSFQANPYRDPNPNHDSNPIPIPSLDQSMVETCPLVHWDRVAGTVTLLQSSKLRALTIALTRVNTPAHPRRVWRSPATRSKTGACGRDRTPTPAPALALTLTLTLTLIPLLAEPRNPGRTQT